MRENVRSVGKSVSYVFVMMSPLIHIFLSHVGYFYGLYPYSWVLGVFTILIVVTFVVVIIGIYIINR